MRLELLLELFDGYPRLLQRIHNYTCLDHALVRKQDEKPSTWMAQHVVATPCSHHDVAKALERLYRLGCSDVPKLAASHAEALRRGLELRAQAARADVQP